MSTSTVEAIAQELEEQSELELFAFGECFVYAAKATGTSMAQRAQDWGLKDPLAVCSIKVVSKGSVGYIRLYDLDTEELFAQAVMDGLSSECLERTADSSRYFVCQVRSDDGKKAFLGFGFRDRDSSDAFLTSMDFHDRHINLERRRKEEADEDKALEAQEAKEEGNEQQQQQEKEGRKPRKKKHDFSLGAGTITLSVAGNKGHEPKKSPRGGKSGGGGGGLGLAPPPEEGSPLHTRKHVKTTQETSETQGKETGAQEEERGQSSSTGQQKAGKKEEEEEVEWGEFAEGTSVDVEEGDDEWAAF